MREFNRIERITKLLDLLWSQPRCADMRLGQLLINAIGPQMEDFLWDVEDDAWEHALTRFLMKED
jgi:hypothetical protein